MRRRLEKLGDIRAELEKYRQGGMTPKNMKLIRQVLNESVWERVVNCPTEMMKRARSLKDRAPVKAAVTAEIAVAIAILTMAPVRAANFAAIRLDENLIKPGGLETPHLLVFPHYDVKNRVDLTFEFDDYLTDLIDEYVQEYRPSLFRGSNGDCRRQAAPRKRSSASHIWHRGPGELQSCKLHKRQQGLQRRRSAVSRQSSAIFKIAFQMR